MSKNSKIAAGIILAAGLLWLYMQYGTATIAVTSQPDGAIVRIDGKQRGITPISRLEVDAGNHRISISHSHFEPHVEHLSLTRGSKWL